MSKMIDTDYMEAYHEGVLAALDRRMPKREILTSAEAHSMFNSAFGSPSQDNSSGGATE